MESLPENERFQEQPALISSNYTVIPLDPEHTTAYTYRSEGKPEYCVETIDPKTREVARIFPDSGHVARVLYELGYTAVFRSGATAEQLEEYHSGGKESEGFEWDVVDLCDNESYYLLHLTETERDELNEVEVSEEIEVTYLNSPVVKIKYFDERHELTYDNTMVVTYHKGSQHREFSHIAVRRDDDEILYIGDRGLLKKLIQKKYPRMHLPQIDDPGLIEMMSEAMAESIDDDARELLDIADPDEQ